MTDKTKSQTYDFLSKNKSIEDIKQQPNIFVKEIKNKRHSGQTYRIDIDNNQPTNDDLSENNRENLKPVTNNLINNEKEQEIQNDIWTKFKNYLNWPTSNTEELIQTQKKYIEQLEQSNLEKDKENQQLKNENQKLKVKQSNVNLTKFSYNAITIYDEKQRKKTGIEKIHEEILSINNKVYFITTLVHIDNSITEKILYFDYYKNNNNLQVINQTKNYKNINDYKKDILLINEISNHNINNFQFVPIKDFLKHQQDFKLKPTAAEKWIWFVSWLIPITLMSIGLIHPPLLVTTIVLSIVSLVLKETTELFSPVSIKVKSWIKEKFYSLIHKVPFVNKRNLIKTKEQQETEKNIKKSIENLTSDKLETRLQTQYDILKQELDNKKDKNWYELINNETINHTSNNISENLDIESENNQNFDSSIRNTVNQQMPKPATSSNHNWNKVKCLFT